ncbi:MAG: ECF transporter S component [Bacilli bacterium]|nr:ECF transporter S component [Bacilli bacterium]
MSTRKIAGTGILLALTIVLTIVSNYIQIGTISINLSLIPIALAAMIYGPWAGLLIGMVNGGVVLLSPSTGAFLAQNPVATVFLCLLKTGLAGLASGFVFKWLSKKNWTLSCYVCTLIVPFINTGLFLVGVALFFNNFWGAIVSISLLINFGVEVAVNLILAPSLRFIMKYASKKVNLTA